MTARTAAIILAAGVGLASAGVPAVALAAPSAAPCQTSSSPLAYECTPAVLGPNPQSVRVLDYTSISVTQFLPGSKITVSIPGFPKYERTFGGVAGQTATYHYVRAGVFTSHADVTSAANTATFIIQVPDNVRAPGTSIVNITGHDLRGNVVALSRTLQFHTTSNVHNVAALKAKGYTYNITNYVPPKKKTSSTSGSATGGSASNGSASGGSASQPTRPLAFTGAEIGGISLIGVGLLGTGALLVVGARRRRSSQPSA